MKRRAFLEALKATAALPLATAVAAAAPRLAPDKSVEPTTLEMPKETVRGEMRFKTTNAFDGTAKHPEWPGAADDGPG
jgi:hypothetical protein